MKMNLILISFRIFWLNGYYGFGGSNHYQLDNKNYWEFVWDRIGGAGGIGNIFGVKAAPDGVAIDMKLIYEGGRGGVVLWWKLFGIIFVESMCM